MHKSDYEDIRTCIVARAQMLDNASADKFWNDHALIENIDGTIDRRRSIATQIDALGLSAVEIRSLRMPRLRFAIDSKLGLFLADIPVNEMDQAGRPTGVRIAGPLSIGPDEVLETYRSVCRDLQWRCEEDAENALREVFYQRPKVPRVALAIGFFMLVLVACAVFWGNSCQH